MARVKREESTMRKVIALMLFAALCASASAGNVANFVELGFSPDGKIFAFGQYGTDDKTLSAYADIFFVDVAKNEFVPGANVSSPAGGVPGAAASSVFKQLKDEAALSIKRLSIKGDKCDADDASHEGRAIYAEDAAAIPHSDGLAMSFRDFETDKAYDISLSQSSSGSGAGVSSSFYITAKITGLDGKTESITVGNPGYERKGVIGYRICRIITDPSNRALVFVVEKEMYSPDGTSVRYMVETAYL